MEKYEQYYWFFLFPPLFHMEPENEIHLVFRTYQLKAQIFTFAVFHVRFSSFRDYCFFSWQGVRECSIIN
jgi:hypothetical protein